MASELELREAEETIERLQAQVAELADALRATQAWEDHVNTVGLLKSDHGLRKIAEGLRSVALANVGRNHA